MDKNFEGKVLTAKDIYFGDTVYPDTIRDTWKVFEKVWKRVNYSPRINKFNYVDGRNHLVFINKIAKGEGAIGASKEVKNVLFDDENTYTETMLTTSAKIKFKLDKTPRIVFMKIAGFRNSCFMGIYKIDSQSTIEHRIYNRISKTYHFGKPDFYEK
jgi:hypothetical protein